MQSLLKSTIAILASSTLLHSCVSCQELADQVFAAIDSRNDGLRTLNTEIWENPEIGYQEVHAHQVLTDYLEEQGFKVTRSAYNLSTAFRAEFSNGTPAEEGGGGKETLATLLGEELSLLGEAMSPGPVASDRYIKLLLMNPAYRGSMIVAAHAAAAPWAGQNALDGFVAAYQMAGLFRQQLQPSDRIHHVVTKGWSVANIIPDYIESQWGVRGNTRPRRDVVLDQVQSILYASGNGTNTTVEITPFQDYWDQNPSFQLASTFYQHQMKYLDPANDPKTANFTVSSPEDSRRDGGASASSDQGNVSWFLPAIQVGFPVGGGTPVHNAGFRELAGTDFAHESAIQTAKILALTGLEVLKNETYAETMWKEWKAMIEEVSVSV
ncbi:hypothetical protein GQ607_017078 [Colletotrichum asianum]|uniref:Peptidase M20 domain-containing protein 2 n=1 Tax=Colletotrichum asianum TaxID=702518 RepID=A0A8H3VUM4_9PEZI|nr:hypothetical protein GQ607_017078 [Colletotrichum asianum]